MIYYVVWTLLFTLLRINFYEAVYYPLMDCKSFASLPISKSAYLLVKDYLNCPFFHWLTFNKLSRMHASVNYYQSHADFMSIYFINLHKSKEKKNRSNWIYYKFYTLISAWIMNEMKFSIFYYQYFVFFLLCYLSTVIKNYGHHKIDRSFDFNFSLFDLPRTNKNTQDKKKNKLVNASKRETNLWLSAEYLSV